MGCHHWRSTLPCTIHRWTYCPTWRGRACRRRIRSTTQDAESLAFRLAAPTALHLQTLGLRAEAQPAAPDLAHLAAERGRSTSATRARRPSARRQSPTAAVERPIDWRLASTVRAKWQRTCLRPKLRQIFRGTASPPQRLVRRVTMRARRLRHLRVAARTVASPPQVLTPERSGPRSQALALVGKLPEPAKFCRPRCQPRLPGRHCGVLVAPLLQQVPAYARVAPSRDQPCTKAALSAVRKIRSQSIVF